MKASTLDISQNKDFIVENKNNALNNFFINLVSVIEDDDIDLNL